MFPADVVIGWVKDGKAYLSDRHTHGHFEPHEDDSQDWILLHGEENDFGTVMKITRKLDTCDEDDFIITDSTVKGIYAYHADDPVDGHPLYHGGEKRGAKNLMLMNKMKNPELPEDVQTIDFLNHQFAPVIQEGHYSIVHHILVYKCPAVEPKYEGTTYECYEVHNRDLSPCRQVFLGWEVGGGEFYFPENVGMPIGEEDDASMFIMETHYNNPQKRMDYVDNSGIRIWYTPTLRQHDSGLLMAGVSVSPNQIIPPHMDHFLSSGFCTEDCLKKGLNEFGEKGVTVFAIWQHGHLLARRITTRLIRDGVEQPPLADDKNFDFNYQDYRHLHDYRTLKSGGISTRQEMCISFIFYYPRMLLDSCETYPNYQTWDTKGEDKAVYADKVDWTQKHNRDVFLQKLNESSFTEYCHGERLSPKWQTNQVGTLLQPKVKYEESPSKCSIPTTSSPTTHQPHPPTVDSGASHRVHPIPTENYAFHEILDNNGEFHLYWNVNKTHIAFETHVKTWGYVAFGFSTNGKMFPADDRHTTGHFAPIKDKSQDWTLLHGEENNFGTLLKMVRKLDTCDEDDFVITDSTMKGIYAYSSEDPENEEYPPYHGSVHRGAKNLMLLNKMKNPDMPSDVQTIDFLNHQFYFPENVGMPIGEPDDPSMFVMETHYNNPEKRMDYVDNSGIRIWYTPTLREHDSGLLMAGVSVSPNQIIPPYMDHILSSGFCTENCLNKGGISTRQEMCISFIFYYPRMLLDSCETFPNYQTWDTNGEDKALYADQLDWTQKHNRDLFLQKLNESTFTEICHGERLSPKVTSIL
ncbi:hypothetical protein FSP39_021673 [Pinctada imbricata]|uniref:DOMON domain-containing protein n=1 Tax=Pinctada imbricata TaxID=66713 RepID=A0AA88XTX7_PINIB|nr:hypothetical protein FSP39_021673 [Pinctada imbricata]